MDSFNLKRIRESLPKELPNFQGFFSAHTSMNPDEDEDASPAPRAQAYEDSNTPQTDAKRRELVLAEPKPIPPGPRSNLGLMDECDNFPYYQTEPKLFFAHINTYYALHVKNFPDTELGYMLPSVVEVFRGLPDWELDDTNRTLTLVTGTTEQERSKAVAATCQAMRVTKHFKCLAGWRDELYPVYGLRTPHGKRNVLFSVERSACPLFGVVSYGCHMTAYVRSTSEDEHKKNLRLWVPRRAATKQTYGGMLDNTVAGGIATGESALESMIRECTEEASLSEDLVRKNAVAAGTVTYFHIRGPKAGGETRLLQPECQYVYDLELTEDVVPKPSDDEVESFELLDINEVQKRLRNGEFKPNCALVLIDFFVRHGILTAENEPDYVEIVARLHRRFEFPCA